MAGDGALRTTEVGGSCVAPCEHERERLPTGSETALTAGALHMEEGAQRGQSGGEEAVQIDLRGAICAFILIVGLGCLLVSRAGAHVQGKESLKWLAAIMTVSLVPLAVPGSSKRTSACGKSTRKRKARVLCSQRSKRQ